MRHWYLVLAVWFPVLAAGDLSGTYREHGWSHAPASGTPDYHYTVQIDDHNGALDLHWFQGPDSPGVYHGVGVADDARGVLGAAFCERDGGELGVASYNTVSHGWLRGFYSYGGDTAGIEEFQMPAALSGGRGVAGPPATSLPGTYQMQGTIGGHETYRCTLQLTPAGETLHAEWLFGNEAYRGKALYDPTSGTLVAGYRTRAEELGVALYEVGSDGTLTGRWTVRKSNGVGTENGTRQ